MNNTNFILSCESTVDMPFSYIDGRGIKVLFYSYNIKGQEYIDNMDKDPEALNKFYELINSGNIPSTSQINEFRYEEYFREILQSGKDIFHICFGTGMTGSYNNALLAVNTLKEEFPDRKIIVIDSLCSSSGYGMLVDDTADLFDEGLDIELINKWVFENRNRIHHQFYSTTLKYFRRTGRISGPAAGIATLLKICPIMHLNDKGKIIVYDKVMGKKAAIKKTIDTMEEHVINGKDYNGKCFISHSNSLEDAKITKEEILKRFSNIKEVKIFNIGIIIASHTGPGTVAVFFHGDERK